MKKLIILISLIALIISAKAQFPNSLTQGNKQTNNIFLGAPSTSTGFGFLLSFADSSAANVPVNGVLLKNIPGFMILIGNQIYVRNTTATQWIIQGGGGSGSTITSKGNAFAIGVTGTNDTKSISPGAAIDLDSSVANKVIITNTKPAQTSVLDAVTDIASFSNSFTTNLVVKDTIRGGNFRKYDGSDAADNGMIFTDADGNKWIRVLTDTKVRPSWYGASPSATGADNLTSFNAARDYIYTHRKTTDTWYLSGNSSFYQLSSEFYINQSLNLLGDGTRYLPTTKIQTQANHRAFYLREQGEINVNVFNFWIEDANIGAVAIDSTIGKIDIRTQVHLNNIYIPWSYNIGININSCLDGDSTTNPYYGAADFSKIEDCKIGQSLIGIKIAGCDANAITFNNCWLLANSRWGIYDSSQLGCSFYNIHTDANANQSLAGAYSTVSYGGNIYTATLLGDDGSNIGKRPDLAPTYWKLYTAGFGAAWDTTVKYWSGGAFCSINPNATSTWYSPYTEGDQPGAVLNSRSLIIGSSVTTSGSAIATFANGSGYRINGAYSVSLATPIYGAHFVINGSDPTGTPAPMEVNSTAGENIMAKFINSNIASSLITFEDTYTAGVAATIGGYLNGAYINGKEIIKLAAQGVFIANIDTTAFLPDRDIVTDFGSPSFRWKNGYFSQLYGGGANITGVIHPADTTAQWITDITRTSGVDSFYYRKGGILYGIKDSTGGGASGITVGTTTITSGTDKKIPFNNAGVYGETTLYYPSAGVLKIEDGTNAILKFTKPSTVNSTWWNANGINGNGLGWYSENYTLWRFLLNEDGSFALGGNALAPPATLNGTPTGYLGINITTPTSMLHVDGSLATKSVKKTANYTAGEDNIIEFTSGTDTLTLPTAVGISGRHYTIVNSTANDVRIVTTSSQTIGNYNTALFFILLSDKSVELFSDNSDWKIKTSN